MIRKYKKALIISSLFILLPTVVGILLWDRLPSEVPVHWGLDGEADSWSSISNAVFPMPILMLCVHWICIWITAKDPGNKQRNQKVLKLMFWIIPVITNFACGMIYALALGSSFSVVNAMISVIGLLFVAIGNYMPKCRMNSTIGIKIPWTYSSEANWNATHRFAGKFWVMGGLLITLCSLIPGSFCQVIMVVTMLAMIVIPVVYSCLFYRKEKAQGKELKKGFPEKNPKIAKISSILLLVILAGTGWLMFSGDIVVSYGRDSFQIQADYYEDLTVTYEEIDSIEYRTGNVDGTRVLGFKSARLLLGLFQNEEFGYYTRYTYTRPEACIVLTSGNDTLVISSKTASQTKSIYLDLLDLTGLE